MWKLLEGWESIALEPLGESRVCLLEFVDEPMLLVSVGEESSTDLEQQSIVQQGEDSIQHLHSEQE
jgi:hypothetical protein